YQPAERRPNETWVPFSLAEVSFTNPSAIRYTKSHRRHCSISFIPGPTARSGAALPLLSVKRSAAGAKAGIVSSRQVDTTRFSCISLPKESRLHILDSLAGMNSAGTRGGTPVHLRYSTPHAAEMHLWCYRKTAVKFWWLKAWASCRGSG